MVVGPFKSFDIGGGKHADLYLLRFGSDGALQSPQTAQLLRDSLGGVTDVFVFSHGWNNTFDAASSNYERFIKGYMEQRAQLNLPAPANYQPVLVGVIWPSTSFLFPWEGGPQIAADSGVESARTEEMLRLISDNLDPEAAAELVEIIDGRTEVTEDVARKAAEILVTGLRGTDPDDGSQPPAVEEVLTAWAALDGTAPEPAGPDDFGGVGDAGGEAPRAAGIFDKFDPRNVLRMGTVWLMKDRAGKVGAHGVSPLVKHVLDQTEARLHLVGHSFGARVVLSSLAAAPVNRSARSMLLLQPAVNRWCFAEDVIGSGRPGGYRPVLERVELPIMTTFSKHDAPLRQAFHLAVRGNSLGEPDIAAVGDTGRYGALGGYGPAGLDDDVLDTQDARAPVNPYIFAAGKQVSAMNGGIDIDGRPAIGGHSDINNPATWWALHSLTGAV
jgi:hypothetical protein